MSENACQGLQTCVAEPFSKWGGGTSTQVHVKKLYKLHYFRQNFTTMKTYRLTT